MMRKLFIVAGLLASVAVLAQKEKAIAYINTYKEIAINEMIRSGVPASITLAQGILESQSGESDLARTSNNHFGIKCKTEWTGAKTYHDDDEKAECFRVYPTVEDSYKDHSEFLKTRPHYAFLFQLDPTDYEGWAKGLKKAGYATSPTYPQKLLKVINDYNLQQYSLQAIERMQNGLTVAVTAAPQSSQPAVTEKINPPAEKKIREEVPEKIQAPATAVISSTEKTTEAITAKPTSYPQGVFTINHSKVIFAPEGSSLLAMANQFDIVYSRLLDFNDLSEMDVLDKDRLIFLEKKMKKGAGDFHIVQPGENLHDISQAEGVRIENLQEYNRISRNAALAAGDKIYLHPVTATATSPVKQPR